MNSHKPFIFVLMPFDPSFDDIYKLGIKETAESLGTYCERVDEQIFEERILDRIYNQINKADIVISDLTGRNPNVFYETGYAHALNKKVILLTKSENDIPFDLRHHTHIIYNGKILELKEKLEKRLMWYLENPDKQEIPENNSLEFYLYGNKIEKGKVIGLKDDYHFTSFSKEYGIPFRIDVHNSSDSVYNFPFTIGVVTNDIFNRNNLKEESLTNMGNGYYLHISDLIEKIYPKSWTNFNLIMEGKVPFSEEIPITLKIFNQFKATEVPFIIKIKDRNEIFDDDF